KICMLPTAVGRHTNIDVFPERFEAITEERLGEFEQLIVRREGRDRHRITGIVGAGGYRGDAGDAGTAPSRLRRPRDSERAVAGRRGGGATPAHWMLSIAAPSSHVAHSDFRNGSFASFPPSRRVRFAPIVLQNSAILCGWGLSVLIVGSSHAPV